MRNLILFVSVIAVYIGLNEALPTGPRLPEDCNHRMIEFQNKLGTGQILNYTCAKIRFGVTGKHGFLKFNEKCVYNLRGVRNRPWVCWLTKGPRSDLYLYELKVELSPPKPPCKNGLRTWIIKSDGIYLQKNGINPMKLVGRWKKNGI